MNTPTSSVFTEFVNSFVIKPDEVAHIHLGTYTKTMPAKGYQISIDNTDDAETPVESSIRKLDFNNYYMMQLDICNTSSKKQSISVWEMPAFAAQ